MARGGKRENSGPKTAGEIPTGGEDVIAAFQERAVQNLPIALEALERLAAGVCELRYVRRTGQKGLVIEEEATDGEGERCWLYTHPPNERALFFLIEHAKGKAAQQATVQRDLTINLIHHVDRPEAVREPDRPAGDTPAAAAVLPAAPLPAAGDRGGREPRVRPADGAGALPSLSGRAIPLPGVRRARDADGAAGE